MTDEQKQLLNQAAMTIFIPAALLRRFEEPAALLTAIATDAIALAAHFGNEGAKAGMAVLPPPPEHIRDEIITDLLMLAMTFHQSEGIQYGDPDFLDALAKKAAPKADQDAPTTAT